MKKINSKGFTLVELLAVIVIMGILMMVAIPSVSRTIENSRKDTFVDIAKSYANAVKTLWTADGLTCGTANTVSSAVDDGNYYVQIDTSKANNYPVLVDQGGKSSWGNRNVKGYVRVNISTVGERRITKFYITLSDGTHGIIDSYNSSASPANPGTTSDALVRGNVKMTLTDNEKKNVSSLFSSKWIMANGTEVTGTPSTCVEA